MNNNNHATFIALMIVIALAALIASLVDSIFWRDVEFSKWFLTIVGLRLVRAVLR